MKPFFGKAAPTDGSFLPEDYVARKAETRANFIAVFLFSIVMFLVVSAFFVTHRRWSTIRVEQVAINDEYAQEKLKIEQLETLDKERGRMLAKAEVTTALLEKIPRSVLMAELTAKVPTNVTVEELELTSKRIDPNKEFRPADEKPKPAVKTLAPKGKAGAAKAPAEPKPEVKPEVKAPRFESGIKVSGLSSVYNDITDFAAILQASPLLEKVELVFIKETKIDERELHKFEIVAQLRANADARALAKPENITDANKPSLGHDRSASVPELPR
ncbi:MAG: PilN domain-containing protein [Tepidisphaera sp.]